MTHAELEEKLRQLGLLEHQLRDAMSLIDQYIKGEVERAEAAARLKTIRTNLTTLEVCASDYSHPAVKELAAKYRANLEVSIIDARRQLTPPAQQEKR